MKGLEFYNQDLVKLEPNFVPASLQERKDLLEKEKPFIKHYEYADFCGYSTVKVNKKREVVMTIYANVDKDPWSTINVTELFKA